MRLYSRRHSWFSYLFALLFLLLGPTLAQPSPASVEELKPSQTIPLLAGRISIRLASNAIESARSRNVMEAEHSAERETRIVTPIGDGKLVLFARETYGLGYPELLETLQNTKLDAHPSEEKKGDLTFLCMNPARWVEVVPGGELVNEALVILPDQTVVSLQFFVTPDLANSPAMREFVKSCLDTVHYERALKTGGPFEIGELQGTLPDGWAHWSQNGDDFTVDHFVLLERGDLPEQTIGVYRGDHPGYIHEDQEPPLPYSTHPGKWLGREVTWYVMEKDGESISEAILPLSKATYHVWYRGQRSVPVVDSMTAR